MGTYHVCTTAKQNKQNTFFNRSFLFFSPNDGSHNRGCWTGLLTGSCFIDYPSSGHEKNIAQPKAVKGLSATAHVSSFFHRLTVV